MVDLLVCEVGLDVLCVCVDWVVLVLLWLIFLVVGYEVEIEVGFCVIDVLGVVWLELVNFVSVLCVIVNVDGFGELVFDVMYWCIYILCDLVLGIVILVGECYDSCNDIICVLWLDYVLLLLLGMLLVVLLVGWVVCCGLCLFDCFVDMLCCCVLGSCELVDLVLLLLEL